MNEMKVSYKNVILDQLKDLEGINTVESAELSAILYAAIYQNDCLIKIINTKMTSICPSLASEAFTTAKEVAEKIEGIRNENRNQTSVEASGAI